VDYITLDNTLLARLRGISEPVEVRDESGAVVGLYTPARSPAEQALYEKAKGLFDLEKARRVAETERGQERTTAEVLERLRSQGPAK
jgi:hypothetical protein